MPEYPENPGPLPALDLRNRSDGGDGPLVKGDSRKSLVEHLQEMLLTLGHDLGDTGPNEDGVDGVFGDLTMKAVRQFQSENKDWEGKELKVDIKVGPRTSDALNRTMVGKWYDLYPTPRELVEGRPYVTVTTEYISDGLEIEPEGAEQARVVLVGPIPPSTEFMVLLPALGLPAISNERMIDVLILLKKGSTILQGSPDQGTETRTEIKQAVAAQLSYVAWSEKDASFDSARQIEAGSLRDMLWVPISNGKITFEDTLHEFNLRIADSALAKLGEEHETSKVLRFHVDIPEGDGLYNLLNRFDETEYILNIVTRLNSPSHETDQSRQTLRDGFDIRIYHPFQITSKEFLGIAHVTDIHLSTRWELYERIARGIVGDGIYNNYNARFEDIMRDINTAQSSQADMIVLTGDLIDYNRGHKVNFHDSSTYEGQRGLVRDYLYNRNWILFYELLVKNYQKPVFTILGNHDYLLNPYPSIVHFEVLATTGIGPVRFGIGSLNFEIPGIEFGIRFNEIMQGLWNMSTTEAPFAGDMNLTGEEVQRLDEVQTRRIQIGDALRLMELRGEKDEQGLSDFVDSTPEFRNEITDRTKGIWFTSEDAALWYFLVINPFKDYAFSHREMAFLMVDWNVGQDKGTLVLLPRPSDCLSQDQMQMVDELTGRNAELRIFCSHSPILDPWPELGNFYLAKARKKMNHDETKQYPVLPRNAKEFNWGALKEQSRIQMLGKISSFPIQLCLSGHSHTNRTFQIVGPSGKRLVLLRREDNHASWDRSLPIITVTTSGGPIGRTNEVSEWDDLIPPGYRIISFDSAGRASSQIVNTRVSIRPEAVKSAVKNNPESFFLRIHDIDRMQTFSATIPSASVPASHSALIDEVSGNARINELDDGRAVVVKRIPSGSTLTIEDNDGTIVVQRNEGTLVVRDNDDIINVDENHGRIIIDQNDDTLIIHENEASGTTEINSNGTGSPGTDFVKIYDNFGRVSINEEPDGNDDTVLVRRNHGNFHVGYNNDTVRIRVNRGTVTIQRNTNGVFEDSEIFIRSNQSRVTINGNDGNIYLLDNRNGTLELRSNEDTVQVNNSSRGNITGPRASTVELVSENDLSGRFQDDDF